MSDLFIGPNRISVDMETRAGVRIGPGPLMTCLSLEYGHRLSESGDFNAVIALSDPRAKFIVPKSVNLAFYFDNEFLFRGIVEHTSKSVDSAGVLRLIVRGLDLSGELAESPVGELQLTNGSGAGVTNAPAAILTAANTFNGTLWSLDTINGYGTTIASLYGKYSGESALNALIMAAQKSGEHFRIATDGTRKIVWLRTDTSNSGVRAIQTAGEPVQAETNPHVCFIQGFQEEVDAYRLVTRYYPYGAGDGDARLTLASTSRTAPAGFTLDKINNYISSNNAVTTVGKDIGISIRFQDIRPVSNTSADMTSAANMLFDATIEHLKRHDAATDLRTFRLSVLKLPARVQVGEIVTVEYEDQAYLVDNEEMVVLAIRTRIDSNGVRTSQLTVAGVARWLEDVNREIAAGMEQSKLFTSHPQRGPNSYVSNYQRYVWQDGINSEVARIPFRFGPEVCQLNQVAFDFETANGTRMLPLESTVISIGGESSGSGTLSTIGPNTNVSGNPDNNTSGVPSNNASGVPSTNVSGSPSNNTSDTPNNNESTGPSNNTSDGPNNNTTGGSGTQTTDAPEGGDVESAGQHVHSLPVFDAGSGNLGNVELHDAGGGLFLLTNPFLGTIAELGTRPRGDHVHEMGDHTHNLASHTHSMSNHTHGMNFHTHSLNFHTHGLNNHTHTLNNHTHNLNNHTHSLNNHTHDLSESITAVYGVYREVDAATFNLADLEYQVNNGGWVALSTDAVSLGNNWYRLDITELLYDANFVPLQSSNLLQFRRKATGSFASRKSCLIDGQLLVRSIIQSISLT